MMYADVCRSISDVSKIYFFRKQRYMKLITHVSLTQGAPRTKTRFSSESAGEKMACRKKKSLKEKNIQN